MYPLVDVNINFTCCLFDQHLKDLQNFNGLMAVAGGLTSSALSRLHQTQDQLSHDCKEVRAIQFTSQS